MFAQYLVRYRGNYRSLERLIRTHRGVIRYAATWRDLCDSSSRRVTALITAERHWRRSRRPTTGEHRATIDERTALSPVGPSHSQRSMVAGDWTVCLVGFRKTNRDLTAENVEEHRRRPSTCNDCLMIRRIQPSGLSEVKCVAIRQSELSGQCRAPRDAQD